MKLNVKKHQKNYAGYLFITQDGERENRDYGL